MLPAFSTAIILLMDFVKNLVDKVLHFFETFRIDAIAN